MPRLTIHIDGRPEPIFVYLDEVCETVQIDFEGVPVLGLTGRNDGGVTVGHWTDGEEWVPLIELDGVPTCLDCGERAVAEADAYRRDDGGTPESDCCGIRPFIMRVPPREVDLVRHANQPTIEEG